MNTGKIGIILLLCLCLVGSAQAAEETTVEVIPNSFAVEEGQTFDVSIIVEPSQIIDTFGLDLIRWDPAIATLNGKPQQGDLFPDSTIWIPGEINRENGTIAPNAWGSIETTDQAGTYMVLNFTAIASGQFDIHITPVDAMAVSEGNPVPTVILNNPAEPEKPEPDTEDVGPEPAPLPLQYIIVGGIGGIAVVIGIGIMMMKRTASKEEDEVEKPPESVEKKSMEKKEKKIKFQRT